MIAALLALTLQWTCPLTREDGNAYVPREARVYRHRQSPTWTALHPAMLMDDGVWAYGWERVRAEAAAVLVATVPLGWPDVGRAQSWATADTLGGPWFYWVTTVDAQGRESRQSNEQGRE